MCTLSEKIEKIERLKKEQDFQQLLNESYKTLKNPILMYDTNYKRISHTEGVESDDRFWNELVTTGTFSTQTQEFFKEAGFIDDVANARVITFMLSDKLKYERISGKIFNKNNIHVASLTMIACEKPFEPDDPAVFEALCGLFSNKISTSKFFQDYENTYQEELIRKLIDGDIVDKGLYAAHIAILYGGLKTNLYAAVLDFTRCNPEHHKLEYYRDWFRSIQPAFKYAVYTKYIVVIISTSGKTFDVKKDMRKLRGVLKRRNIYAGISGCFENIYELRAYYADAVKALEFGMTNYSDKKVCLYDEIKEYLYS